jgi:DNA repair protein SbcC/Rad50
MRLHHLTATAFGPFADTVSVDFEELNDAGLFLLTGPTGAGKSSLLDAVCFALYGQVPGARGVKTLKSQHAGPDARPEVVLDFSVRDRRFVVRRTPEWSRPKKRGDGFTPEKAAASITETTHGKDDFLSSRAAEVGLLINDLMGMTADQFVQVALLPQGEFQRFLRASSQERHDVLQHLFRTNRFARIEDWVHEHSRELKDRSGRDQADVQRLADAVADRSGTELPEDLSADELPAAAGDGRLLAWAAACRDEASTGLAGAADEADRVRTVLAEATDRHRYAEHARERSARRAAAEAVLRTLAESDADVAAGRAALSAAERAATCQPLIALLDQTVRGAETAEAEHSRVLASVTAAARSAPGVDVDPSDLLVLLRRLRARATRLETLVPRELAGRRARRDLVDARTRMTAADADHARLTERATALPHEVEALTAQVRDSTARAARREALTLALTAARRRHDAARDLPDAEAGVTRSAEEHRGVRDALLTAREQRADLVARRLAEMAAELAGSLADGAPCQVCGSTDHPAPAQPATDAVTAADQEAAETRVAALTEALETSAATLRHAEHRRDVLDSAAEGVATETAAAEVERLLDDLAAAETAEQAQARLQADLDESATELAAVSARQATVAADLAGLRQTVAGLEDTVAGVAAELAAVHDPDSGSTLEDDVRALHTLADQVERAIQVAADAEQAAARAQELRGQADEAAEAHGFGSLDEARAAVLDPDRQRRLAEQLAERDRRAARAQEVLDEILDEDADAPTADDLPRLAADVAEAATATREAERRLHLAEARLESVTSLMARLDAAVVTWAPLRDESLRAESMSRLVRGMGQDNQLQMRLSAYVLATRLDQVVAAANERLGHMRDQRYLLQRTDRAARKGSQAGLGLEVVDQWTGDARDPSTLSGGETFVVSLSLALGLADVVTQEAGGTEIETLFVDEGFGTLDADTLDDVMDRLDGLRAGGRTVGVVSHVSELRNRIPTQVHVQKGRTGSTVTVATLVG